jgi:hypothetical protein
MSGGTESPGVLGRGPLFWGGLMATSYLAVAALGVTGAVDGAPLYLLVILPFALVIPMIAAANRRSEARNTGCGAKGEAQRRYMRRVALFSFLYLVVLGIMTFTITQGDPHPALRTFLALLPGLSIIGIFWSVGRLIVEEQDEFLRMLVIRQSLIATGIAMGAASAWGFLETAEVVPHLDAYWWAVVWFLGLGVGAAANRLRYGTWGAV